MKLIKVIESPIAQSLKEYEAAVEKANNEYQQALINWENSFSVQQVLGFRLQMGAMDAWFPEERNF